MPIPEKEYVDALRQADQRAVDLLAKANADRVKHWHLTFSYLLALASVLVAVMALLWKR